MSGHPDVRPALGWPEWGNTVLAYLTQHANVPLACKQAGISTRTFRHVTRGDQDHAPCAEFVRAVAEAEEDATGVLLAAAWRRGVEERSDPILQSLLKAYIPEKFNRPVQAEARVVHTTADEEERRIQARAELRARLLGPGKSGDLASLPDASGEDRA